MNRNRLLCLLVIISINSSALLAQDTSITRKKYVTARPQGIIELDGIPDEEAWNAVEWGGDFTEWTPNEGHKPTQPTNFKILYDDRFLYLAYRAWEESTDSISKRMGRRDEFPGDWVEINIDSYHDLRTAFSFTLSVSGVRNDEFISNNGTDWDPSWNPIWFAKTHIDDEGWTAEVKIPLSQLRYGNAKEKVWGIQLMRRIFRKEERSTWQYIPQKAGVWVSSFGELHGLKDIPMHRQVEIAPYILAKADTYKKEPGNPFATGVDSRLNGGIDGKVAITNDLILDFTINPDFGQVEADPSQVRLDGYQNFFSERRPFFIESRNIFNYQLTGSEAGGDYDSDLLFYTRRIGGSPHGSVSTGPGEYVDYPQNTSIIGAAKFSGKTKKGWSVGILESIADREYANVDHNGDRRKELVEPVTNYFVGRLQKDIHEGNTILGGIFTAVNRGNGLEDVLHREAYSGGMDFLHYWNNRTWYIRGNLVFSNVSGSRQAIVGTQTSFEHLFQRPGKTGLSVDTTRTSLTGTGGTFRFGKLGGKGGRLGEVLKFETGLTFRSPELELNDIGFMLTANEINHFTWIGLHFQQPHLFFRNARLNYNHWSRWDFGGRFLYQAFNFNSHATFKNNWQGGTGFSWNPYEISNNALRGAASLRKPSGAAHNFYLVTDYRKKVYVQINGFNAWGSRNTVKSNNLGLSLTVQPLNALRISIGSDYSYYMRLQDQFVSNVDVNGMTRSIVAHLKQNTLRFTARASYNITPDLTLQYYGQPYITRPLYSNYAYVVDPLVRKYHDRFAVFEPGQLTADNGTFLVDENKDGITDYTFDKPDFNFVQFRSNLVIRWEYSAGSELYLVWSQGNTPDASSELDKPLASSLFHNAFLEQGRNIFLVKCTYRFLK